MSMKRFIKSSGAILILAGLFIGVATVLHPAVDDYSDVVHTARWNIVHGVIGLGLLLALIGLTGLYLRITDENDIYGMAGYFLAITGTAISSGMYLIHEGVVLPALDMFGDIDTLLAPGSEIASTTLFNYVGAGALILTALGYILLGLKIFRSESLPRWTGILLLLGGPLFAGPAPTIGAVLIGAGFVWIGFVLWSDR